MGDLTDDFLLSRHRIGEQQTVTRSLAARRSLRNVDRIARTGPARRAKKAVASAHDIGLGLILLDMTGAIYPWLIQAVICFQSRATALAMEPDPNP